MKLGTLKQKAIALFASCLIGLSASAQAADNCNPCCKNWSDMCGGFTVGADFLLWKACVNDLDYGIVFDGNPELTFPPTVNATPVPGSYQYVGLNWEPGFRVRIGKEDLWCGWDLGASYTWYEASKGHGSTVADGQFGFDTLFHGGFNNVEDIETLQAKYSLHYQSFDILLGYKWCINPCSILHPFFGIEGLKIKQDIQTLTANDDTPPDTQAIDWESDYRAIGLKAGTDYHYTICDGLSLFSLASVSLLAGKNDQENRQLFTDQGSVVLVSDINYISNDCFCMPGLH
ncbi:MAG: hypothetical protein KDK48_04785, partial [Chlamydiia bacterium]|nr:hypothetical protein [Chlamydiia bacterium]